MYKRQLYERDDPGGMAALLDGAAGAVSDENGKDWAAPLPGMEKADVYKRQEVFCIASICPGI